MSNNAHSQKMASQAQNSLGLQRLDSPQEHHFSLPEKKINDGDDLQFFHTSLGYRDLTAWLIQLNRSMFASKDSDGKVTRTSLDSTPIYSKPIQDMQNLISDLNGYIEEAPPDTGPRRFGNVAFRTWFKLVEDNADALLEKHLASVLDRFDQQQRQALRDEIKVYLLGSFGSAQRLDYGTGHELSFVAFLGCLWIVRAFDDNDDDGGAIVMGVIQPYLELMRKLILTYTLEPAGSHGVWGLDDHSFVPYIFGSAQLSPAINFNLQPPQPTPTEGSLPRAPKTNAVVDKERVDMYRHSNMYFAAIQFIYDVKRGPFWEHSPVLYDISGIKDGWGKVNKGLLKMYAAEVLEKFPVVQHFPFGSLFRWEVDPEAVKGGTSVHTMQQPKSTGPSQAPTAETGMKAPWANTPAVAGTKPSIPGGIPSTMAPWARSTNPNLDTQSQPRQAPTTAPWASTQRNAPPASSTNTIRPPDPRVPGRSPNSARPNQ